MDATVRDEGRTFEGLTAITAWRTETKKQYRYTVEPVEAVRRDGQTVVTARVSGDFPGSPVTLTFIFRLERDQITSLEGPAMSDHLELDGRRALVTGGTQGIGHGGGARLREAGATVLTTARARAR